MNPRIELSGAEVGVTESVLLGVAVRVGVSTDVIWIVEIGSGMAMVEIELGMKGEVATTPFCSNLSAIQPMERMLTINITIKITTTIFFSKNNLDFIKL